MDEERKLFARKMFKLRVHESKGSAYQRLFETVMGYRDPDFTPIKPHGSIGDRKNDGYSPGDGVFHQVYAPEEPGSRGKPAEAAKKAKEDFEGLIEHWDEKRPINEYRFVFNDAYLGSPPPVEDALAAIENSTGIKARSFLAKHLEDEALQLDENQLMDIIGTPIPHADVLDEVDFGVLSEVVVHVLNCQEPATREAFLNAPDFSEKIRFNGLSGAVEPLLRVGSYQIEAINDYFSRNSNFAKQHLRDHLAAMYAAARTAVSKHSGDDPAFGDLIFFELLERVTPPDVEALVAVSAQNAALVILAYYFEACDVFEDPDAAS